MTPADIAATYPPIPDDVADRVAALMAMESSERAA